MAGSRPFGSDYASIYDATYASKDYEHECDVLEQAFRRHGGDVRRLLDVGCGTGNHALVLARRGFEVAGVDLSASMLDHARRKAADAGVEIAFTHGDARAFDLQERFDAVLLLFAVIGYQRTNDDVRATLATARRHLDSGGLLVCDMWFGPGVLTDPPGSGARIIGTQKGRVERQVTSALDVSHHLSSVQYTLSYPDGRQTSETHVMRFFFPLEFELFLTLEGFELVSLSPAGSLDGTAGTKDWTALAIARAV